MGFYGAIPEDSQNTSNTVVIEGIEYQFVQNVGIEKISKCVLGRGAFEYFDTIKLDSMRLCVSSMIRELQSGWEQSKVLYRSYAY